MITKEGGELRPKFYQIISVPQEYSDIFCHNLDNKQIPLQKIECTNDSCLFFVNARENLMQGLKGINDYQFVSIDTPNLLKIVELLATEEYSIDSIELLSNENPKNLDPFKDFFHTNNVNKLIETIQTNNIQLDKIKFTKNGLKLTLYNTGLFISNLSILDLTQKMKKIFSSIQF
ncbi:hypothetical protein [uncultured Methanospirillum sp.]|uniref:hypothetical protein n=1 Tax=uncultured Methanospirillum sp. TaxID=262503 RepID=UPI0029C75A9C|nr:hypothetical protein [uncultured Methanospirillum sp.]